MEKLVMDVEAIFFDMDGTLVHIPFSVEQFLRSVYRKLGLDFSPDQISLAREQVNRWWNEEFPDYTLWTREAFIESNYRTLKALGAEGDLRRLSEEAQSYWDNLPEEAGEELYPEVESVLKALGEKGVILGVLSNRISDMSLRSLEKHGIRECFQLVVSPQIAGAPKGKKGPEMWRFALNRVGAQPGEVLHVDNDYEDGVVPAGREGIRPVLVDRKGEYAHVMGGAVIQDLTGSLTCWRKDDASI